MECKKGDIVMIKFPFTDLKQSKKRPVLVIKSNNEYGDFICLQITSKFTLFNSLKIEKFHINSGELKLISYLKYDKCFTLNSETVDKKLADVTEGFSDEIKRLFCDTTFQ